MSSWTAPGGWRVVEIRTVRKGQPDLLRFTVIRSGVVLAQRAAVAEVAALGVPLNELREELSPAALTAWPPTG
jgi:hypothetical protein